MEDCTLPQNPNFRRIGWMRSDINAEFLYGYFHSWQLQYDPIIKAVITVAVIEQPNGTICKCELHRYILKFFDTL